MRDECCHHCYNERPKVEGVDGVFIGTVFFPSHGMICCRLCGNKRCPKATDHRNECTRSNEPGQPGSIYK